MMMMMMKMMVLIMMLMIMTQTIFRIQSHLLLTFRGLSAADLRPRATWLLHEISQITQSRRPLRSSRLALV
eukprot:2231382-Karenia_brevis.AAC.1